MLELCRDAVQGVHWEVGGIWGYHLGVRGTGGWQLRPLQLQGGGTMKLRGAGCARAGCSLTLHNTYLFLLILRYNRLNEVAHHPNAQCVSSVSE